MEKAQLASAIHQLFQTSDQDERQMIERNLNELGKVKLSIAVYLRNFIRKVLNQSANAIETTFLQRLLQLFYETIVQQSVELHVKRHLILIFESLLMVYQAQESNPQALYDFYNAIFSSFQTLLGQQNIEVTKGVLLICQATLQSIRGVQFLSKTFPGISTILCKLAEHYISLLSNDLMVISAGTDLSLENPRIQSMLASLDLLQEWVNIHESILERWESKKQFGFAQFALNNSYAAVFGQIIAVIVNVQGQSAHSYISITGIQKLDNLLNKIKIKTLECMNYIFKFIFDQVPHSTKNESPFLVRAIQLCPLAITSMIDIAQRQNIEDLAEDETYSDIIVESLESLAIFAGEKEFYDQFSKYGRHLLVNVCLTLMRTSKHEYEQMTKDPDSFVNLALDTCDKQKSKIVKTQAAKLLESICDNIDGTVSFIALFACQSINLALDPSKAKIDESFYNNDYLAFQSSIFLNSPSEIIGETCLVALTTISYILPRRADLVPIFESVLANNIDKILSQDSILLRTRMSLLLGYYADMLFEKFPEAFNKTMDFLIKSVALVGDQKVIAQQSADTLNTIISDKDLIPRLEPLLPWLIGILNECNMKIHIKLYFSFLLDFVKHYNSAIGDSIIPFIRSLVHRVLIELKSCHEKGEKNNLIINKIWNIIRAVIEFESFIPIYYTQIEDELKPLFEFMIDPAKIEFEDDIILTIKTFIKKTGQVSPTLWTLFPHLSKVFEKSKNTFGNLLDTLNQYLVHGKEQIAINREFLTILVNMASTALFSTEPSITIQNSEGAILFQLLFQVYAGSQCLDEYFENILNLVVKRMNSSPMDNHLKRHLLCVFLTAMAYNPTYTMAYLEKNAFTTEFFTQLFGLNSTFINIYERKIYIIGLSNALNAENLPPALVNNVLQIMQNVIKMLNALKDAEAKALKRVGKKEIKEDEDDDDEDDEDEDEEDVEEEEEVKGEPTQEEIEEMKNEEGKAETESEEEESDDDEDDEEIDEAFDLNVTMDLLNAPFKKTDEFAIFNQVLRNLHSKDPTYVNNMISQLQEDERKFLREHIETKRIKIEHKGVETEVARRIIKVKRRGGVGSGASGSVQK